MDKRLIFLLNRAQHIVFKHTDQLCLRQFNITAIQLGALFYLAKNNGCLLKDLSQGLGLNNSAITGLVGRMQQAGLVKKHSSSEDGRASQLFMTEKGKHIPPKASALVKQVNKKMLQGFSQQEIDTILRFLDTCIERF